jgi:hypothetical protein
MSQDDAVPEIRYRSRVVYTSSLVCGRGETVDARDLKSLGRKAMPVQVRPSAPVVSHQEALHAAEIDSLPSHLSDQNFG